ncbi:uncharacterized protein LOC109121391 isoform X2 [Vitis vinifera]|nr:uncharacterized protein LOC109121391 isoform X2 [Vitis vinifera]
MAKSKESSKQYSLQKGVVPKLYLQTRCSPERVIRVIENLEPKQKAAIEEIGFGSLLQLRCRKIDHGLCLWLINSFNPNTYMLQLYNTCIKLSPIDVEFIMGLRARGLKIGMNKDVGHKNDLCKKYCDKKGRLPLVMLENQIREDKEGGNDFKVRFVLFVLGALLCPTMKLFVNRSFLHIVEDIDSIKKMNWAEFVLSYLVHGIEEFKKKQQSGVCGCLLFLMLFYHEHISFEEKFLPLYTRPSPRITAWGDDEVLDRKRRLKKLGGYANEDLKIWVIENEIRDCVDGNAMTMASENEDDEKFVSNLNKDVIKRVDGGKLMEMDKTFQQLKTHLLDMAYGASSSSCDKILAKFEENYTQVKGLFLRSSGKPLRMHEEGTKNDMLSCERSLEDTNNMNVNEHYLHTLSNEKLCTEDFNEKNEDACATSIEVHIILDENENILPLPIKRSRRDYGKEPLRALCCYPNHVMKTRSSRERKPSKFKVSLFVQKSRKMVKREASE